MFCVLHVCEVGNVNQKFKVPWLNSKFEASMSSKRPNVTRKTNKKTGNKTKWTILCFYYHLIRLSRSLTVISVWNLHTILPFLKWRVKEEFWVLCFPLSDHINPSLPLIGTEANTPSDNCHPSVIHTQCSLRSGEDSSWWISGFHRGPLFVFQVW